MLNSRKLDDWLTSYMKFTQNSEPPPQYHLWSGIMAISSALRRKTWCNWGLEGNKYPNLYVCLVGPPGGRKGTAMKIAKSLVQNLDIPMGSDSVGSIQTIYQEVKQAEAAYIDSKTGMEKKHKSLSIWSEEFQVFLSDSDPRLIGNLTDLFDSPDQWKYTSIGRGKEDLSNCWMNIIGAITPSLLQSKLSQDAVGGGLISRIIFVVGYGKSKKVPLAILTKEEEELRDALMHDLEVIAQLCGPFQMTNTFLDEYIPWYSSPLASAGVDSDKFVGYNERRALHLKKLCMIFSASESNDLKIKPKHFKLALETLRYTEREMQNAFYGIGRGLHAPVMTDILRTLRAHGSLSFQELSAKFSLDVLPEDLIRYMSALENAGRVKIEKSVSGNSVYHSLDTQDFNVRNEFLDQTVFKEMK